MLLSAAMVTSFAGSAVAANNELVIAQPYDYHLEAGNLSKSVRVHHAPVAAQTALAEMSIWGNSATPVVASDEDANAVQLGLKFTSSVAGYVTGIRFYKNDGNTGAHVGYLWDASGQKLATVTFAAETASGWQEARFATPVYIQANTTFVASYYAPNGHYASDVGYFRNGAVSNGPLQAIAGVYRYGTSGFPISTYNYSNYWVDLLFSADTTAPTVPAAPANLTGSATSSSQVSLTWADNSDNESGFAIERATGTGSFVQINTVGPNVTSYVDSGLSASTQYVYRIRATNAAGSSTYSNAATITTPAAASILPMSPSELSIGAITNSQINLAWQDNSNNETGFLIERANGTGSFLQIGSVGAGVTSYVDTGLQTSTQYTYRVRATNSAGKSAYSNTASATTLANTTTASIWGNSTTPVVTSDEDANAVQLGLKFRSSVAGYVTAIRFYKGVGNTGTHVGYLWSATGQKLATVTFADETASGWQEAKFATPVYIQANTTYVASYYAPKGHYAADVGYFRNGAVSNGPLQAIAGVYRYGTSGFPTSTYNYTNYWVDVVLNTGQPTAKDDHYSTAWNTPLTVEAPGVLANDLDLSRNGLVTVMISGPSHGTLLFGPDGSFIYTPSRDYVGLDSFTYKITDGLTTSNVAIANLMITRLNSTPVAQDDNYKTDEDVPLMIATPGLLANDADVDGDKLSVTVITGPSHGTLTSNPDGSLVYTPTSNYYGVDSFTYQASDGLLQSNPATVTIAIASVNDAPALSGAVDLTAIDEDIASAGNTGVLISTLVAGKISDVDSQAPQGIAVIAADNAHGLWQYMTDGGASWMNFGTPSASAALLLAADANTRVRFVPNANWNGTVSGGLTFRAWDQSSGTAGSMADTTSNGGITAFSSATASASIVVTPVNDAPTATDDRYTTDEDTVLTIVAPGVLATDNDVEGDPLRAALVSGPSHGTLTIDPTGSFVYTPAPDYYGMDSFTYRASDGALTSNAARVSITANPVNDVPFAKDDRYITDEDTPLSIPAAGVLVNDGDADGDTLAAVLVSGPLHGTATLNADGSFTYTPIAGYSGTDSFTYQVSDGRGQSNVAAVVIITNPVLAILAAPSNLTAVPFSSTQISLTWSDNSSSESGFAIERRLGSDGAWERVATVGADATGYTDGGLYAAELYQYRVTAFNARGSSVASNVAAASIPAVLVPGSGWTGPTPQPAPVGDPSQAGYDAKAIARWDVVPYQTFTSDFAVGIPAFHMNGIDRVEFSVNNGPWVAVRTMTLNPLTNVVEYWVTLQASAFAKDGPVEVRAVAYPKAGVPRVLEPLFLNANGHATLMSIERYVSPSGSDTAGDGSQARPFASIMKAAWSIQSASGTGLADGGVIYLMPGDHVYGTYDYSLRTTTANRWLTITSAPGVAKAEVRITSRSGTEGLRTKLVHLQNVTVAPVAEGPTVLFAGGVSESHLWIDDSVLIGVGRTVSATWTSGWSKTYVSGCDVSNSRDGISGELVRDTRVHNIGSDAFSDSGMVINSTAESIDPTGTSFHPDVVQYYGRHENLIVYGLTAVQGIGSQGLFAGAEISVRNVAFVNVNINNQSRPNVQRVFQFGGLTEHMYVLNSQFVGPASWMVESGFSAKNVVIESTQFSFPPCPSDVLGVTFRT